MTAATKGPKVSEAAFQAQVLHLAALKGWRTAHFRTAMDSRGRHRTPVAGDGKGFPDLVLARLSPELRSNVDIVRNAHRNFHSCLRELSGLEPRGGARLIFAELKSDAGRLRPDQADWLADLAPTGAEVYVWRPADFDRIVEVLS